MPNSEEKLLIARRFGEIASSFLEGNCKGGRFAHGLNTMLCSAILYALITWAFLGQDSAWERFKRLEQKLDAMENTITNNAQFLTATQERNDNHFTRLDGQVTDLGNKYQSLNTQVQVIDATTLKVGHERR